MSDTKIAQYEYAVHPLAALFPELKGDDFLKLKTDIQAHGQVEPIMLDANGEVLLDGRNRLRVCKELQIAPILERFTPTPTMDEADFIWSKNVRRRHLTADQRAALTSQWADTLKKSANERRLAGLKKGEQTPVMMNPSERGTTRQARAQQAEVSEHKIQQVEVLEKHAPELVSPVAQGTVKLKDAEKQAKKKKSPKPSRSPEPAPAVAPSVLDDAFHEVRKFIGGVRIFLSCFESDGVNKSLGYAAVEPEKIRERLTQSELITLVNFKDWTERILKAKK